MHMDSCENMFKVLCKYEGIADDEQLLKVNATHSKTALFIFTNFFLSMILFLRLWTTNMTLLKTSCWPMLL